MSKEKIILSAVATLVGLIVAGAAFYLYQQTKVISPQELKNIAKATPTPTPLPSFFLAIDSPKDEDVVTKKVVSVSGKTTTDATIAVVTSVDEKVVAPDRNGNFSTTVSIDNDQNVITITAVSSAGEEKTITRTVTFSTEDF